MANNPEEGQGPQKGCRASDDDDYKSLFSMALHGQDTSYEIFLHEERCRDSSCMNNFCSLYFTTEHYIIHNNTANCICIVVCLSHYDAKYDVFGVCIPSRHVFLTPV
jgi:hypothetical protein